MLLVDVITVADSSNTYKGTAPHIEHFYCTRPLPKEGCVPRNMYIADAMYALADTQARLYTDH